jgi:hypothetical protein
MQSCLKVQGRVAVTGAVIFFISLCFSVAFFAGPLVDCKLKVVDSAWRNLRAREMPAATHSSSCCGHHAAGKLLQEHPHYVTPSETLFHMLFIVYSTLNKPAYPAIIGLGRFRFANAGQNTICRLT